MTYPGGKNSAGVYQRLVNEIPAHETFIEGFTGSAAIFRKIRPAERAILIDLDPAVIEHLKGEFSMSLKSGRPVTGVEPIEFICGDAVEWLDGYNWMGREFCYLDPPYLRETLRDQTSQIYRFPFGRTLKESRAAHTRLLSVVLRIPAPVMLSGYANSLYSAKLKRWRAVPFAAGTRRGRATEVIWMNYPAPVILHDYQYFGANHRERTDFKRLVTRWRKKLEAMPLAKRQALIHHLAHLFPDPRGNSAATRETIEERNEQWRISA